MQPFMAYITPVSGGPEVGGGPIDPSTGHPWAPGHLPPMGSTLPGSPGFPSHGLPGAPGHPWLGGAVGGVHPGHVLPPAGVVSPPIVYPDPPGAAQKPVIPPESIYPPLPPESAVGWILVWLVGIGYRWMHVGAGDPSTKPVPPGGVPTPPEPTPMKK